MKNKTFDVIAIVGTVVVISSAVVTAYVLSPQISGKTIFEGWDTTSAMGALVLIPVIAMMIYISLKNMK